MKILRCLLVLLLFGGLGLSVVSCRSGAATATQGQPKTVSRGNLTVTVTGVGNLALSDTKDLAFELDGTVSDILVEEAQSVNAGQVVARLSATDWQDQITALEDKVTAAQRTVTAKERAVTSVERTVAAKEQAVIDAQRAVDTKTLAVLQTQANLNSAQLSLEQTQGTTTDPLQIEIKKIQVQVAQGNLEAAQQDLQDATTVDIDNAKQAVDDANAQLSDANLAVDDANKALQEAQSNLDDAKNTSPEITAPFAGFITKVNVAGGDVVKKGTVAVTLADPSKFEADIPVSELDILQVKLGGLAQVQADALAGLTMPATVTHISPTATISQGVVSYKVTVQLLPLSVSQNQTAASGAASANATQPRPSFTPGAASGNITVPSGNLTGTFGNFPRRGANGQTNGSTATGALANVQPKQGMTVTVSIIVDSRTNVLLVPNAAITTQSGQAYVEVVKADGSLEKRTIQTGISDFQSTEVISGLSEGEQVMVTRSTTTATTSTTNGQRQGGGGGLIPGGGLLN